MRVVVTGWGVVTALGLEPSEVLRRVCAGDRAPVRVHAGLAAPVVEVALDVIPFLRRKKDRKLLSRAAELAIPAAASALGACAEPDTGVFLGIGREPPEEETEDAVVAAGVGGSLDPDLLDPGRWPPLASLRTLPNLTLAHVAIQFGLTGESATRAGGPAAGLAAIVEGWRAVAEGRAAVVLAGAADSLVAPALVRDQIRAGGPVPCGEAAAFVLLESLAHARDRGAHPLVEIIDGSEDRGEAEVEVPGFREALGACGAADGALAAVLGMAASAEGRIRVADPSGARAALCWVAPPGSL